MNLQTKSLILGAWNILVWLLQVFSGYFSVFNTYFLTNFITFYLPAPALYIDRPRR